MASLISFKTLASLAIVRGIAAQHTEATFPSDWQPDIANWGAFPTVPHATWADLTSTAEANRAVLSSETLQNDMQETPLLQHSENLQAIAYGTPERNRAFGTLGHNFSALYIHKHFEGALSAHYDVSYQPFEALYQQYNVSASADGRNLLHGELPVAGRMTYSATGRVEAPLALVPNIGCNVTDFNATQLTGKIALIHRGICDYGLKAAYAGAAGAVGVIIYNNLGGDVDLWGTLILPVRPEGPYTPTVAISQTEGEALVAAIESGQTPVANIFVEGFAENRTTMNLVAQTKGGDQNNVLVLGAHADSVPAGPGINDNGSGMSCLLEVALALTKYNTTNAVRFVWWSAEEFGLAGSQYYIDQISEADLAKIRLYLNFDMIASPNYVLGVYETANLSYPAAGSAEAEALMVKYLNDLNKVVAPIGYNNRSDYNAFLPWGVPTTGPFTGAEFKKTEYEAHLYGGTAGEAYDPNYHLKGDVVDNLNMEAFLLNTKMTAHAVATYATSFESLGTQPGVRKRQSLVAPHSHSAAGCQEDHSHDNGLGL